MRYHTFTLYYRVLKMKVWWKNEMHVDFHIVGVLGMTGNLSSPGLRKVLAFSWFGVWWYVAVNEANETIAF